MTDHAELRRLAEAAYVLSDDADVALHPKTLLALLDEIEDLRAEIEPVCAECGGRDGPLHTCDKRLWDRR